MSGVSEGLLSAADRCPDDTLRALESAREGLGAEEAARRLGVEGSNEVAREPRRSAWRHLWHCYRTPFSLLLSGLALLSALTGDVRATVVIAAMVVLSTVVRFLQERRAHEEARALRALVSHQALVLRPDRASPQPIRAADLVRGDVVSLAAGDMVPADCRLMAARDFFVSQSSLTGESMPIEKFVDGQGSGPALTERTALLFMGSSVVSGTATAVVLATGARTLFGELAQRVTAQDEAPGSFQHGINQVSVLLLRFALVIVPLVFLLNGFGKGDWWSAFLFALSVAVGLTPEMLPMIVTTTLAKGAVMLSRRKVIVKRLDAIQNFGAMDVLCTDKTGTLTRDEIVMARHTDAFGVESRPVLEFAFLNSHYQTGLHNLLDRAVLARVDLAEELQLEAHYRKVDEIPFDFVRRRLSVVVSEREDHHELICKGALEEVLAACTQVRTAQDPDGAGVDVALDGPLRARVLQTAQEMNAQGLRVVAVAMKELPPDQTHYGVEDERGLTLVGYVAFLDPPRESAPQALRALAAHGVRVKVLTGDNATVALHVCAQVGLVTEGLMLGPELDAMDDAALARAAEDCVLFAKLTPLHKERIVRVLRASGHVTGFLGDGINDAPALRAADIGISVDGAVDIAREAADIILLEKSLAVLDDGVMEGRTTFANMLKYIRTTASSNFGNVLSVLVASVLLPFLPMLPLQLLLQNLLYDFSQVAIPFDRVDPAQLDRPLHWHPREIGAFMLWFGPVSSVFDLLCFGVLWWVVGADGPERQSLFQSGWFVLGMLTQLLAVHLVRSPQAPWSGRRPAPALVVAGGLVAAVAVFLPMGPLAPAFGFEPLPHSFLVWVACLLAGYALLAGIMKRLWLRHHAWQ